MHKPPHNKQLAAVQDKAAIEAPPGPEEGSAAWLEDKGWQEVRVVDTPNPAKRWLDPRTGGASAWFYSFTDAVNLQLERDGKRQTDW